MRASVRAMMRVLLLVTMLAGMGSALGVSAASAAARPAANSATPGVPTSTIKQITGDSATYCVDNYAPNSTVTIVNQSNHAVGTIHTDSTGSGCTTIRVDGACTVTHDTIVASGVDAMGNPATSQAIADVPADPSKCKTASPTPTASPTCDATQVTLSSYVVAQGHRVRGTACGFLPGESVELYILPNARFVGNTLAHGDSTATMGTMIPVCIAPGRHTFEFVGETSHHVATAEFTVTKAAGCAGGTGAGGGVLPASTNRGGGGVLPADVNRGGGPTGGLAFTGADILAMVLVALALLVIGTIAVVSVRRRRPVPTA